MLAQAEEIEARLLREHPLRDELAQVLRLAEQGAVAAEGHVSEAVDADHDRAFSLFGSHRHLLQLIDASIVCDMVDASISWM
ncbi:hypothetical protein Pth03_08060 [Planotetraspora thailandica]|uniref:Uncharacterized protein n=1 Tax=Planotetraspora thailandica TaxID=487172 RepID=A0A8J3XRT8_9ACTN|nr:hypothetical protein Pth03_08060 [Planotetraspora thailandica]